MARRILLLGDALCSAALIEALRERFDGELVHLGAHVGIQIEAGASDAESIRVMDAAVDVIGCRAEDFTATFEPEAFAKATNRFTLRDIEPCMPVLAFDRERFDLPYGKKARRAMRRNGGRR